MRIALLLPLVFALAACAAPAARPVPEAPHAPRGATTTPLDEAAARGAVKAREVCAMCHALVAGQASPRPPAPPFPTLAGRFTELTLARRLAEIAEVGHTEMPPLSVSSEEVEDLVAYLNSQPAP